MLFYKLFSVGPSVSHSILSILVPVSLSDTRSEHHLVWSGRADNPLSVAAAHGHCAL